MPRTGLAYEKPSRASLALIVGFTIAVVVMAGWLVMMIMFSHDANTMAAAPADLQVAATSTPPRVESLVPIGFGSPAQSTSAPPSTFPLPDPTPSSYAPYSVTRDSLARGAPPSALPLAAPAGAPRAVAPPSPAPAATFTTAAVPEAIDRNMPDDDRRPRVEAAIEAPEPAPEVIPLPPPKPRRVASIPVPRPRPHLDGDDAPPQDRSFLDVLFNRQR